LQLKPSNGRTGLVVIKLAANFPQRFYFSLSPLSNLNEMQDPKQQKKKEEEELQHSNKKKITFPSKFPRANCETKQRFH
jgi:hypothetical protein